MTFFSELTRPSYLNPAQTGAQINDSDALQMVMEIGGTDVILSGTVRNLSERDLAKKSAWSPGVHNVIDNLVVS